MDYNFLSIDKVPTTNKPLCTRARLDTGTFCNYDCSFCYYRSKLDIIDSLQIIKDRIEYIKSYSLINQIELSGGESSIHPQWFEILSECSKYFNYISTLSNGSKFKDKKFMEKSKLYGLKEILFSMHGYGQYHDKIVNKNNAFENLLSAINNSLELNLVTRINCTVTTDNKDSLFDFTNVILELIPKGISQLNFILHNFWEDNKNSGEIVYEELCRNIVVSFNTIKEKYPDFDIRIRYTPFCMFKDIPNFDKYIYGQFQHIFDTSDWNREVLSKYKFEEKNYSYTESLNIAWEISKNSRLFTYYKPKECVLCKYFKQCDGIEKQLKNQKVYPI